MKRILLLLSLSPLLSFAQTLDANAFYNSGADVYVQEGALLHVQGTLTNTAVGSVYNDGVIELKGDIDNTGGLQFQPMYNGGANQKAVKFVGDATQYIKGDFGNTLTSSFYNLVIDKGTSGSAVVLQNNTNVEGSLVFGTATTGAASYTPTLGANYTNNSNKGVIRTYDGTTDYELFVFNSSVDAIKGYPTLGIGAASNFTDSYVQTRGARGVGQGGLKRNVDHTGTDPADAYVYPIGTAAKGFQALRINFATINNGADAVRGMFCDGPANAYIGHVSQYCIGCGTLPADNSGINIVYGSPFAGSYANPCGTIARPTQWVILEDAVRDHGYWSFKSNDINNNSTYSLETFPRSFTDEGMQEPYNSEETWRTLHYSADVAVDPSGPGVDWGAEALNVSDMTDLVRYTRNAGCYDFTKPGVPGGIYTGFSHFAVKKSKSNNALPVEMLYLKAEAVNNQFIQVLWATSVEINNSGFQVLRSTDGITFTNIGWVDGHNNSTATNAYTFDDNNVAPNVVYYYKLNQVDNDGHSEETYIVNAMITSGDVFSVSEFIPNPATDNSRLVVTTTTAQTIGVKLFDMLGRQISEEKHNLSNGQNTIYFDTNLLANATYTAVLTAGSKVYSKKLVISHN
ncbi:MAG: T9SS type A sorting domain-containing protein [Chitinophagales bacterium]|nr:T9SS type A sorting domain-containing protein [Chitinophagales bacterium]